jgi:hypothetical protein
MTKWFATVVKCQAQFWSRTLTTNYRDKFIRADSILADARSNFPRWARRCVTINLTIYPQLPLHRSRDHDEISFQPLRQHRVLRG